MTALREAPSAAQVADDEDARRPRTAPRWVLPLATVAAVLPIVVATARALAGGWLPIGDNAYFTIRARDVLTEHHPLLGTWTSASITAGEDFNNPGPLLFDLYALPAKLGGRAGVAIGAAALNVAAVVGIGLVARRRGGPLLGVAALAVTGLLTWSMGSELLFDPWQPHSLLLTSLLLALLVWSVADGDLVTLPIAAGVASLVVQTHLSYAVLVAALGVVGSAGLVLARRRLRRDEPGRTRRPLQRTVVVTLVVVALAWAQPLVEQVAGEGRGNLTRLATSAGGAPEKVGPALATRLVAQVVARPPLVARPSFEEALAPSADGEALASGVRLPDLPGAGVAVVSLGIVAGALAVAASTARRRGDRVSVALTAVAGTLLVAALVTTASLPIGGLGVPPHQARFLWPVGAVVLLALLVAVVRSPVVARRSPAATAVLTGAVVALAVATLPTSNVGAGPAGDADVIPVVRELQAGMAALEGEGPLVIDMRGIRFAEPYSGPVMAELQRRGIPFVVDDEGMVRQMGESRRAEPGTPLLRIREGDATQVVPPGERRAVLVEGLDDAGQRELEQTRDEVVAHLTGLGSVPLSPEGEAARRRGDLPVTAGGGDAGALVGSRELVTLVEEGWLDLDPSVAPTFERWAGLQRRWDLRTVALFVAEAR